MGCSDDYNETTNGTSSISMTYNAIGNITSKTVGGNTFTYSYSASHKHAVSGVTYNGTTYSYTYDANGNMTYGADFTNLGSIQVRTITYNADNMPTQISHSSNITTQLTYGGTGERVRKRVYSGGNVTDTYYIGDHFEVKTIGGNTEITKYIFAGNLRVAQIKNGVKSFFHKDHLGSSTVMTNASGAELASTEYFPFGAMRSSSSIPTNYLYTDQELDAENGLYNYNARLYDPFIGRFISPDTIVPEPFNPQSLNRYSYVLNNPLIYVDPSGHELTVGGAIDWLSGIIAGNSNVGIAYYWWGDNNNWIGVDRYGNISTNMFGLLAGPTLYQLMWNASQQSSINTSQGGNSGGGSGGMPGGGGGSDGNKPNTPKNNTLFNINTGISIFDIGQGAQDNILEAGEKIGKKMGYSDDLAALAKYKNALKVVGKVTFTAQAGISTYQAIAAIADDNPHKGRVISKAGLDILVGAVAVWGGPVGWGIGIGYFVLDQAGVFEYYYE